MADTFDYSRRDCCNVRVVPEMDPFVLDGGYDLDGTLQDAVWVDDGGPE